VKIRKATSKDLVSIQKMEGRIFNNPWSNKSIRNELKRDRNSLNLVAEMDQKIIGYFFAHLLDNEIHILNIAIDVTYQHQGYGKQFFKEILENYLQYGDVYLEVKQSNFPAINLYLNFGFEEIDIREAYYADGEDAVIMVKREKTYGLVS
jgi:ribosomal-protein-alanine N-acetyltransferase